MQANAVPEALWPRLSEFIAQNTGLHFPLERRMDLLRGLQGAAREFGFATATECADWLLSEPLTKPQLNTLASHLTVGETYFFRERKTFDALAQRVLPKIIRSRGAVDQRLRIWSAACCTGEEAYSLAIMLQQVLPDWPDWRISILATDINERFLEKAQAGVYGEWSFRDTPPGFREQYFTRVAQGRYEVKPQIRERVTFAQLNLVQDPFPSLATGTNAMDLILCRNVLIYFTAEQMRNVVENLRLSLVEDGWLAVSPSECSQTVFSRFESVNYPSAILYKRTRSAARRADEQIVKADALESPAPILTPPPAPTLAPVKKRTAKPPEDPAIKARELANEGELRDAVIWSERWVNADKLNPAAHYLHAMIALELGRNEQARRFLQHAIYLQPEFALAHFALGNLARGEARRAEADKHFANALHVLDALPPQDLLPQSDGLTAGRLKEIITALRGVISESGRRH